MENQGIKNSRTCAFCSADLTKNTKSKEHVWPRWLQRKLNIEKLQIQGDHLGIGGAYIIDSRIQSTSSIVLGDVCSNCNNGWMSELENRAIPVLEPFLFPNERKYIELDEKACKIIAAWSYKTSLVLNLASNYKRIIPKSHFREFYETVNLPKNVVIDVTLAPAVDYVQWLQGQHGLGEVDADDDAMDELVRKISSLYAITLNVAGTLLKTSWVPTDFLEISMSPKRNVKRIWPFQERIKLPLSKRDAEITQFHLETRYHSTMQISSALLKFS